MIRSLTGKISEVFNNIVILDVNGIGFEILCSRSILNHCRVDDVVKIVTSLQFSESGATIYGFESEREREFFLRLTGVKGVGGKTAIAILSELSIDNVINAISSADVNAFMKVSGIGKKTAERLCFELKLSTSLSLRDISPWEGETFAQPSLVREGAQRAEGSEVSERSSIVVTNVIDALLSLGFTRSDAGGVINLLRAAHGEEFNNLNEEDLLRMSLRELHK